MKNFLVYFEDLDGYNGKALLSADEVIRMKDENDFTDREITRAFDVTDPDNIKEIHSKGWQPNCLIEFVYDNGDIAIRGYGTDH